MFDSLVAGHLVAPVRLLYWRLAFGTPLAVGLLVRLAQIVIGHRRQLLPPVALLQQGFARGISVDVLADQPLVLL